MYKELQGSKPKVSWRKFLFGNMARSRANFILWLACRGRLMTKDKLSKIGVMIDRICSFCDQLESCNHLFFECCETRSTWTQVPKWLKVNHTPLSWESELIWVSQQVNSKSCRSKLLNMVAAKTTYEVWAARNRTIFQGM